MTVKDLKNILSAYIEQLEKLPEDKEVNEYTNTYGHYGRYLATYEGFVYFDEVLEDEEY